MSEMALRHWEGIYESKKTDEVSWFQSEPMLSLRLIESVARKDSAIVEIGAGNSFLSKGLLDRKFTDITVLDISKHALDLLESQLGDRAIQIERIEADVLEWQPQRSFDIWHDRAVFHFLISPDDQEKYLELTKRAVKKGGYLILGTFALDGPEKCSGLDTARYDGAALQSLFSDGFTLLSSEREAHITPSGSVQNFTWVIMQRT